MNIEKAASSRLPGFYSLPMGERTKIAAKFSKLENSEQETLGECGALSKELIDTFIENGVGSFSLPLGIATNFLIDGRDRLIPMAVEESSVIAAASHGAKLARYGGGFKTRSSDPIMTGQIQVYLDKNVDYDAILTAKKETLLTYANRGQNRLLARGGGAKDLTWHYIEEIESLVLHLHIHTADAMGANITNTMCEKLAKLLPDLLPNCDIGLRILTNLTDRRMACAECTIPPEAFSARREEGLYVIERITKAWAFAWHDPYRAATHNKGVMNGIDPVVIATGNDWRAVEAGAHAYCCREGVYRPMTTWKTNAEGHLHGKIELPMAVGTVGGVTKLHPTAQVALKLLGNPNAQELAGILCSIGLAQNLSALRALATEGIQVGHMNLHQKNLDILQQMEAAHIA
ncbi:MAG: hydroxymethylglutaryl-CoA reductase, degradative [Oligoflexales bacterium]|nr:hydroxymethylglutaryl-CoA reductase, degradative [Oligoflexales bacterium]